MSIKNYKIYRESQEELVRLQEEYRMIGHDTQLTRGCLTVFALRRKKPKPKPEDKDKEPRNKRAESHKNDRQKKTTRA